MSKDIPITSSQKIIFGLYGAGGFAREVMPFVKYSVLNSKHIDNKADLEIFFVETNPKRKEVNGYPLISESEFFEIDRIILFLFLFFIYFSYIILKKQKQKQKQKIKKK
jgi:hypothetical protein